MKKIYAIISACFLIISMIGCGISDQAPTSSESMSTTTALSTEPMAPTAPPVPLYQDLTAAGTTIELGETVQGKEISVTLSSVYLGVADTYCSLILDIQNLSGEQIVVSDNTYINNYSALGGGMISINADQTSSLEFSYGELGTETPSSEINKISFTITVTKDFMTENSSIAEVLSFTYYPNGKEAWDATPIRQPADGETLLIDNDIIKLISRGNNDEYFGEKLQIYYLENKTVQDLLIVFEGASGYTATPFKIPAGTRTLVPMQKGKLSAVINVSDLDGNILCEEAVKYTP